MGLESGMDMANLEGALLSDYLLLECISQGNVADVYRARQNDEEQYEVAVKIFRPSYAEREAFRAYFMREVEVIGRFDHPHILPFLEYGEGEGLLYTVTPFIKSGTLEDLLRKVGGRFSAMQAQPIIQQLCDAVQYAHEQGVIHGNIKPGNVFVTVDGRMLLADFGIARSYPDRPQSLTQLEWGTTEYASPEQSLGLLRPASDIYSLGALFFRVLTGSLLFTGETPVEVLLKHVRQEPPAARSLDPNISDAVDDVLYKALAKRVEDRYATALELGQAFRAAVAIAPVASPVARSVDVPARARLPIPPRPAPAQEPPAPIRPSVKTPALIPVTPAQTVPTVPAPSAPVFDAPPLPFSLTQAMPLPIELRQTAPLLPAWAQPPITALPLPPRTAKVEQNQSAQQSWLLEPVEWSPQVEQKIAPTPILIADEKTRLQALPTPVVSQKPVQKQRLILPMLVVIFLIVGLLGALLSSFLLPR